VKNRLAALTGAGPDRGLAITRPAVAFERPFGLPAELGANLIGRRPDIVAARLQAEAAASRIEQKRAEFYPNVNLAALIGVQSLGLGVLADSGSVFGSVGPAITLPIFTGGKLRGELSGAEARYAAAVALYDGALTQALRDVADAALGQRALAGQLGKAMEAVEAASEAHRVASNRYRGGLASYLEVLSAEDALLANIRELTDLRSRSFTLDVALMRALGGGYAAPQG
jgi:NodT family efflux transporter outer membrane factor (OMF) lipoprotein